MRSLPLLFVALSIGTTAVVAQLNCTHVSADKKFKWDLSKMRKTADIRLQDKPIEGQGYNTYWLNFCGEKLAGAYDSKCSGAFVCQEAGNRQTFSAGTISSAVIKDLAITAPDAGKKRAAPASGWTVKDGVSIFATGGSATGSGQRQVEVHVICNKTAEGMVKQYVIESPSGSGHYKIYYYHAAGCPTNLGGGGISWGTVFLIILAVAVPVYLVGGGLYLWKFKGARTAKEMLLFGGFWFALPSLVKDGAKFVGHGFKKGDYISV